MEISGGQAVVRTLEARGVTTVFGLPGVHNLAIYEALSRSSRVRSIVCRDEQGAGFAADGYARTTGRPGVFITTTGPRATNALTAVAEGWSESSPVLHLASQLDTPLVDASRGVIHELMDQVGTIRHITRIRESIRRLDRVSPSVAEALTAIQTGRPRPAFLEFPQDILNTTGELAIVQPPLRMRVIWMRGPSVGPPSCSARPDDQSSWPGLARTALGRWRSCSS